MAKYHDLDDQKQAKRADWIPVLSIVGLILFFVLYITEISAAVR